MADESHGDFAAGERTTPKGPERDFAEGEEETLPGAKRFASREYSIASQRPTLIVDYTPVPAPAAGVVLGVVWAPLFRRRRFAPA